MVETMRWKVDPQHVENNKDIEQAAKFLQEQEVIAFPTETVYGLGADATNKKAVDKIFMAKGRPSDNPLIVHVASTQQMEQYVRTIPEVAQKLIQEFMPGPITIILESNGMIADNVTAGLSTIGMRIPDHPVAKKLIEVSGLPLAAPSANRSGKPSPTSADHVYHDLNGRVAGILDGGPTGVGLESTVVDCTTEVPVILRPGGVTKEEMKRIVGDVMIDPALIQTNQQPKSPGMKYNHYEPDVPLYLVEGDVAFFQSQIDALEGKGNKVGVIASKELAANLATSHLTICGSQVDLRKVATSLYESLRSFKESDVDIILCESYPQIGVGEAIMNRLHKAASGVISE